MTEQAQLFPTPQRQLIGIAYTKRVGKDTAANALVRDLGYRQYAFADELKELAMLVDPVVLPQPGIQNVQSGHNRLAHIVRYHDWEAAKDRFPEVRRFLENLGNGVRARFGQDFWLNLVLDRIGKTGKAVISDVRFTNEAEAIKAAGGKLVRIDRPGHNPSPFESELNDWTEWDCTLDNSGSVVDLEQGIVAFAKTLERQ